MQKDTKKSSNDIVSKHALGRHSNPPPVTLSKAKDDILSGAIAANLQAIMAPVLTITLS